MSQQIQASDTIMNKALKVRALISDVDGVLTNGSIVYDDEGKELKFFNVKDGLIIKHLKSAGILVGVITGRDSSIVRRRSSELGMDFHLHGVKNKLSELEKVLEKYSMDLTEVAYLGDDLNDLAVLNACGLSASPRDAPDYVKSQVDIITKAKGGEGVFREVADFVLSAQGKLDQIIKENS